MNQPTVTLVSIIIQSPNTLVRTAQIDVLRGVKTAKEAKEALPVKVRQEFNTCMNAVNALQQKLSLWVSNRLPLNHGMIWEAHGISYVIVGTSGGSIEEEGKVGLLFNIALKRIAYSGADKKGNLIVSSTKH